jgi:carbonic anhydrase
MLIKLMLGVQKFQKKSFKKMQLIFEQLTTGQNPEILFITCSDSRIIPSLVTHSEPGDLFVIRNVGNIIPTFDVPSSEAAAIEYALTMLPIKDIIICGHSDCGAMKGLLNPSLSNKLPAVASWLIHSQEVLENIKEKYGDISEDLLQLAIKNNILLQIEHLKTYPCIAQRLARNELTLHGWFYEIETGEISIYDPNSTNFIPFEIAFKKAVTERCTDIAQEVVMNYLSTLTKPATAEEFLVLMHLFSTLNENLLPIWGEIGEDIKQRIWDELGGLYPNSYDPEFINLLHPCYTITPNCLKDFQRDIQDSKGYQLYCSQLIRHNGFLKTGKTQEDPTLPFSITRSIQF